MEDEVIPRLKAQFTLSDIVHRTIITRGIPESILAERIEKWEDSLPDFLHLAYLPAPNIVRLRLSAYNVNKTEAESEIDAQVEKLRTIIGDNIVGFEGATVESLVHDILIKRSLKLAVAESCTGGTISATFTAMAGASQYFMAGVTAYSNEAKRDILGVSMTDIECFGAVSEVVALEMAEGVRRIAGADYAIATTGIAGPSGGTRQKPVGTVWIAIATPNGSYAVMRNSGTDRSQIINRASAYAIEMLYEELKKI